MAAVIGDPVTHSLSPRLHNAAFRAVGLDWVYVALPVERGQARAAVDGARALGLRGLSVTMPHKEAVIDSLDGLTSAAADLGAVNCILRAPHDDGLLLGDNTDGQGFIRGLRADLGLDPAGLRCAVVGAGGAGRAVAHALGAGGASVTVLNRDPGRGEHAAALAGPDGRFVPLDEDRAVRTAIADVDLLVDATPTGMAGDPSISVPEACLRADLAVVDLVYHPTETPLLAAARREGSRTANGLSMLVHQAAVAFEHWTGTAAPLDVMVAAIA